MQDLVRYKTHVFDSGFREHTTKYMGPPHEENNKHWEDLYQGKVDYLSNTSLVTDGIL